MGLKVEIGQCIMLALFAPTTGGCGRHESWKAVVIAARANWPALTLLGPSRSRAAAAGGYRADAHTAGCAHGPG